MCFTLYISTDSREDLSQLPTKLCSFERADPKVGEFESDLLELPNIWFVNGRYGGCSCHLRHLAFESRELGFSEPLNWYPEDKDDLEDTGAIYDVLARLIKEGHRVDVVDLWNGESYEGFTTFRVSLSIVSRTKFRFFENHRFVLVP